MSIKQFTAVVAVTATIATIGFTALAPKHTTPQQAEHQRQEQQVHDLAENEKKVHQQMRQDGNNLMGAVNEDELRPVEPRPVDPKLKFKLPLP
ncbi:hypothetical protein SAMN05892883_2823 [Jatrophihabitans sp. GAS493]|uniref:hypothetical protein n=1 Tax=Jatrophihabitans sp. GAS493 TaxID=1907575 RepID=UPI000BB92932|nr:hypothetical protein [Jatrophihabitans sp. GAS493]SOD73532.1 hypothetical protein SAMN05892883_2823 [Jatrophihabitans sp. GAS493]